MTAPLRSPALRALFLAAPAVLALLAGLAAGTPAARAAVPAAGDGFRLTVAITPRTVTVGDRISAVLTLSAPVGTRTGRPATEPRFPTWGDDWGAAEILEVGPVERGAGGQAEQEQDGGGTIWRQRLVLAVFRPGDLELPPVAVRVPIADDGSGRTVEVSSGTPPRVRIDSVLPVDADPAALQPTAAAPPLPLPAGAPFWWTLAGGAVLAGMLLLLAFLRRRRRAVSEAVASLPPFEELTARLDALTQAPPRSLDAAHVALSLALRHYLGRRLDFPATESTTTEVRRRLRERRLPDRVIEPAALVLERCDAVKFARAPVAAEAFGVSVAAARELARTLEEHLAPVTLTPVDAGVDGRRGEAA